MHIFNVYHSTITLKIGNKVVPGGSSWFWDLNFVGRAWHWFNEGGYVTWQSPPAAQICISKLYGIRSTLRFLGCWWKVHTELVWPSKLYTLQLQCARQFACFDFKVTEIQAESTRTLLDSPRHHSSTSQSAFAEVSRWKFRWHENSCRSSTYNILHTFSCNSLHSTIYDHHFMSLLQTLFSILRYKFFASRLRPDTWTFNKIWKRNVRIHVLRTVPLLLIRRRELQGWRKWQPMNSNYDDKR